MGVPTEARLYVGNLQAGVGQRLGSITYPRSGQGWEDLDVFSLYFGYVVLRYGKAHCGLVHVFKRGNDSAP